MKEFETLEELREALMSEHGAVLFCGASFQVFRLHRGILEVKNPKTGSWNLARALHVGYLASLDLHGWFYCEKPKKIVKEEIEGFVSDEDVMYHSKHSPIDFYTYSEKPWTTKAKLIIEREVDE